ncbi:MAG TPA: hypothetical protein VHZ76_05330, partial [Gammaproteobacteria bacterium]|nr:hypothetical protein [Gammaproteobacteria bacterium]
MSLVKIKIAYTDHSINVEIPNIDTATLADLKEKINQQIGVPRDNQNITAKKAGKDDYASWQDKGQDAQLLSELMETVDRELLLFIETPQLNPYFISLRHYQVSLVWHRSYDLNESFSQQSSNDDERYYMDLEEGLTKLQTQAKQGTPGAITLVAVREDAGAIKRYVALLKIFANGENCYFIYNSAVDPNEYMQIKLNPNYYMLPMTCAGEKPEFCENHKISNQSRVYATHRAKAVDEFPDESIGGFHPDDFGVPEALTIPVEVDIAPKRRQMLVPLAVKPQPDLVSVALEELWFKVQMEMARIQSLH